MDAALATRLAALEERGWVGRLERRLANADAATQSRADAAHAAAGTNRWAALTEEDRALADARGWATPLRAGVAGIRSSRAIKCLHAQYGYHLGVSEGSRSPVGDWIAELLASRADEAPADDAEEEDGAADAAPVNDGGGASTTPPIEPSMGGRDRRWKRR